MSVPTNHSNQKTALSPLWKDDKRRLFKSRVSRLLIGDSLVCPSTKWRVDCVSDQSGMVYLITNTHGDQIKRKRLESAVDYLLLTKAPETLSFVQGGAFHLMQDLSSVDELLGFYPALDIEIEGDTVVSHFKEIFVLYHPLKQLFFKMIQPAHQILRFVLQEGQINWFEPVKD